MKRILIIPDVHGRDYWLTSIEKFLMEYPLENEENKENEIVFLGDYVDPYPWVDHVTESAAHQNLLQLFKKVDEINEKYGKVVTMLMGNHDLHYIFDTGEDCRLDYHRYRTYHALFVDRFHEGSIVVAHCAKMSEESSVTWLFSHAGIRKDWFDKIIEKMKIKQKPFSYSALSICEVLNKNREKLLRQFGQVSFHRGGYDPFGSCMWADVDELKGNNTISDSSEEDGFGKLNQVFGHTYSPAPIINQKTGIYMLDAGFLSYVIDGNDTLEEYYDGGRKL